MKRLFAAAAALLLGCALPARAQDFPNRQISMIVVFAPGGATDVLARIAAEHMSRTLGRSVVVENVSGAGGQQVDSACVLAPAAVPQIQAGTMRGLLTAAATRNPNAPNVPSAAEAGVPDYIFQGWNAVFAPRGTPAPVVAKLDGALRAALADPAIRQRIEALGSIPAAPDQQGPEALARLVRSEVDRWSTVVRAAGIEPQ
ncbi:hypothetical protein GWK16_16440 [Roseomonas sp. JC162]|uniref:Tripartite tricarboxylate transporter substrate binding protein n=1 Tax=Neoroseomonas marina TaxID=1232220 RepID=A0A848EFR3_9PROT|nr:tripartite tricarboxylate transporter substrate-binding protein [Neoroseomonas marina]NMJ42836.1 hypothetical protein [Neoroseomonas marina]